MQAVSRSPLVIADCAHNPEAAVAFSGEAKEIKAVGKKVLLFSAMKDKDYQSVLRALAKNFDALVLCEVSLKRSANLVELFAASRKLYPEILLVKEPARAMANAKNAAFSSCESAENEELML